MAMKSVMTVFMCNQFFILMSTSMTDKACEYFQKTHTEVYSKQLFLKFSLGVFSTFSQLLYPFTAWKCFVILFNGAKRSEERGS